LLLCALIGLMLIRINKFNSAWQVVQYQAKSIKTVQDKINLVQDYFKKNNNIHDKERVLIWMKMTLLGYKKSAPETSLLFNKDIDTINETHCTQEDNKSEIKDLSTQEIKDLIKDISNRKYNFNFNEKIPLSFLYFRRRFKIRTKK